MFGLRRGNKDVLYSALIDIGSGTIGVAIVESHHNQELPTLLYTHRTTMRVSEHESTREVDFRRVHEALISATLLLSQEGYQALRTHAPHARISHLFVTCASPWAYTMVRNVRYENDTPFKVTQSILDDLIETAESEMLEHTRKETNLKSDSFEIVERTTVDVLVNDYHVASPLGTSGTTLALSHVAGVIPREIIRSIEEVQDKLFPDTTLHYHTGILAMYCVVRDIFPRLQSYAIVDVTGEATECAIIDNGSLVENTFVPIGSNSLIRTITQNTKRPIGDIQTHLRAFGDGEVEVPEFTTELDAYTEQVKGMVAGIQGHRIFPTNVIITAHRPYTNLFNKVINNAVAQAISNQPTIHSIESGLIDEISHGAGEDVYLALIARFFHKVHRSGEANQA